MTKQRILELLISLHKKVDVGTLSDDSWRAYQEERQEMERELAKCKKRFGGAQ